MPGDVSLDGGLVADVGLPPAAGGRLAVPGLVDLQVNGFAGVDLLAADVDQMRALAATLPTYGVTAFLPTLITAAAADTDRALDRLAEAFAPSYDAGARSLGVHLEGPYLSPRRLGTHPAEHRRDPDPDELERVPDAVAAAIEATGGVEEAGDVLVSPLRGVVVGRGLNLGTAFGAALKLTELTGSLMAPYSPADLLHGPVAVVGPDVPVLALVPDEPATASVLDLPARCPGGERRW